MATILSFKAAERGMRPSLMRDASSVMRSCEIVLFPGVRYEYNAAPQQQEKAKAKRRSPRKRDKLVLTD